MSVERSEQETLPTADPALGTVLHSPGYLVLLLVAALLGVPLSLVAFGFLAAVHEIQHLVWESWPSGLGFAEPPAWWPILALGVAGVVVALAVKHLPGHGGHLPVDGLGGGATPPNALPGIVLAAGAGLGLGAVVGPEAPLIALGSGLALLAVGWSRAAHDPPKVAVISATGSAAAISAIFGNPLVAAIMFLEVVGLARRQTMLVVLPCLVSSGIGALVFTGLGDWTGLEIGVLAIPHLEPVRLVGADIAWAVPLAAVVTAVTSSVYLLGRRTARQASTHLMTTTVGAGILAGCAAAAYAVVTDHSPEEVALSGQSLLAPLASDPEAWTNGALIALLVCKAMAYGLCIGVFRGGPVFPALLVGAVVGVLASTWLPGLELLPALAIGMAAGVAVTGLPVTSVVLVVLLLGDSATSQMPVVIVAVATALVVEELLSHLRERRPAVDARHHPAAA